VFVNAALTPGMKIMNAWNHVAEMDHLRHSAEAKIKRARGSKSSSPASSGHRPVKRIARPADLRQGVSNTPRLGDMSGGFGKSRV